MTKKKAPKRQGRAKRHESSRGADSGRSAADVSEKRERGYEVGSAGLRRKGEKQLMSERLRSQGKWIYAALIIAFGISFALGSVGASGGLSFLDYFSNRQQASGGGSSSTTSSDTASVQQATALTQKQPKNPQAWLGLGDALAAETTGDQTKTEERAIAAYLKASQLKTGDKTIIGKLAAAYARRATNQLTKASDIQTQVSGIQSNANPIATVLGSNPILAAQNAQVASAANSIGATATPFYTAGTAAAKSAAAQYEALTKLDPKDAESWYEAGVWWQNSGEYQKALTDYRKFTTLVPADPAVPTIEQQISALSAYLAPQTAALPTGAATTPKSSSTAK